MAVPLSTLLLQQTKAQIYATALDVATAVGLPVTSWSTGNPTRSLYHVVSELFATLEGVVVAYVQSGFLDHASGDWLTLLAEQVYNVAREEATFATTEVTLTNSGGGSYTIDAGDLTFKNTSTGATYRNTSGGVLAPGGTLDVDVRADVSGSDGNAGATDIDDLVTALLGVTVSNATAATGTDEESDADLRQRCRDKLGSLSPNGPAAAYAYVARTSDLTGVDTVTRVRVVADSDTGDVTVYLATASGAVPGADVSAVEDAITEWATPLCITPTVASATEQSIAITYQLWVYDSASMTTVEVEDAVEDALTALFAARPIGGDIKAPAAEGKIYKNLIEATIRNAVAPHAFDVAVTLPAGDTALTIGQVATKGSVTATITFEEAP